MILVFSGTTIAIVLAVALHYEVLTHLAEKHFKRDWPSRLLMPVGVIIVIFTHVVEVWIFGFLYYFLLSFSDAGEVTGEFSNTIMDCAYFSFVNYTSLGYGDIIPIGHIRFTAGSEALTGLVLIAWTASFTYLQMQKLVNYK
jgi:hypothetical protein